MFESENALYALTVIVCLSVGFTVGHVNKAANQHTEKHGCEYVEKTECEQVWVKKGSEL